MATERLLMRHIREILRLKWTLNRSHRETARSLGVSPGAVASVMSRATRVGLTWDTLTDLTDEVLEARLYGPKITGRVARPLPDPAWMHTAYCPKTRSTPKPSGAVAAINGRSSSSTTAHLRARARAGTRQVAS